MAAPDTEVAAVLGEHGHEQVVLIGLPSVRESLGELAARRGDAHVLRLDRLNRRLGNVSQERGPVEPQFAPRIAYITWPIVPLMVQGFVKGLSDEREQTFWPAEHVWHFGILGQRVHSPGGLSCPYVTSLRRRRCLPCQWLTAESAVWNSLTILDD